MELWIGTVVILSDYYQVPSFPQPVSARLLPLEKSQLTTPSRNNEEINALLGNSSPFPCIEFNSVV